MKTPLQSPGLTGDPQIVYVTQNESPTLSFTHGFIIGQLSVIILLVLFIRFFIFADVSSSTSVTTNTTTTPDAGVGIGGNGVMGSSPFSAYSFVGGNITRASRGLYAMMPSINPAMDAAARIPNLLGMEAPAAADGDDAFAGLPQVPGSTPVRPSLSPEIILNKTGYNVDNHPAETLDWFNVLFAQTIARAREEALSNENIIRWLDSTLNSQHVPDFIDRVNITQLNLGQEFPKFSNCQIGYSKDESRSLEATMDVLLNDTITLGIDTKLLLNYPLPMMAILPVSLVVSIIRFRGKLTISFKPTTQEEPDEEEQPDKTQTAFTFSFSPDYDLDFTISSLIGSRSRLQDIPKVAQMFESRIRKWFNERCVEPRFQQVILPSIWPRSKNTRQQQPQPQQQQQQQANTPNTMVGQSPATHPISRVASRQPSSISLASGYAPEPPPDHVFPPQQQQQQQQQQVPPGSSSSNRSGASPGSSPAKRPTAAAVAPVKYHPPETTENQQRPIHVSDFFGIDRPSSSPPPPPPETGYFRARRPYG